MAATTRESRPSAGLFSETTLVPVSLVVTLLGLAYWVSSIASVAHQAAADVENLRDQRQKFEVIFSDRMQQQQRDASELKALTFSINSKVDMIIREQDNKKR
jgi:hypothetical protein